MLGPKPIIRGDLIQRARWGAIFSIIYQELVGQNRTLVIYGF